MDLEYYRVNPNDFKIDKKRNSLYGGCGEVTFCIHKTTKKKCVQKKTKNPLTDKDSYLFDREIRMLAYSDYPGIVPFVGFYIDQDDFGYIYLYEIENGSLASYLTKIRKTSGSEELQYDVTNKYIISYGIALSMQYLHKNNRIHRDLKTENVLLDDNLYPYITDFGLAKIIKEDYIKASETNDQNSDEKTIWFSTPKIMSPEFYQHPEVFRESLPIDVYSYGITLYEIWTTNKIYSEFKAKYKLLNRVRDGYREKIPDTVPEEISELIEECWSQSQADRPTFADIVIRLRSMQLLEDERIQSAVLKYENFLKMKDFDHKSRINTYERSKELRELRTKAQNGDVDDTYNYIIAQDNIKNGKTDYEDIIPFCKKCLNDLSTSGKEVKDKLKKIAKIELIIGKSFTVSREFKSAENMFRRSMNHGEVEASYLLANLINKGLIRPSIPDEMYKLYEYGAKKENFLSQKKFALLNLYGTKSIQANKKIAIPYIKKCSEKGDLEMMYIWSIRKEYGRDTTVDVKEAMNLMKSSSEKLYGPAMVDYGIHLYNGYHIEKDTKKATELFCDAANLNMPDAIFYYAMTLHYDSDEEFMPFLMKAAYMKYPDALAFYGQYLLSIKDTVKGKAIRYLEDAAELGSMGALLFLGEISEEENKKDDAIEFFMLASNCCHCLDTFGFFTPIKYKVFRCNTCEIEICEGCAKHCHKDHNVVEVRNDSGFKCKCGEKGFNKCASIEANMHGKLYMHMYQCMTCCLKNDFQYICKNCAEKCHKDHDVREVGVRRGFCSCGKGLLPHNFHCCCC